MAFKESEHPRDENGRFTDKNKPSAINKLRYGKLDNNRVHPISNDFDRHNIAKWKETNIKYLQKLGYSNEQAEDIRQTLEDYCSGHWKLIKQDKEAVDLLNDVISKLPIYKGTIYRGIKLDDVKYMQEVTNWLTSGIDVDSIMSFTTNIDVAKEFAGITNILPNQPESNHILYLAIENKNGVSIRQFSKLSNEDEILVPRGTHYRIKRYYDNKENRYDINKKPYTMNKGSIILELEEE